MMTMIGIDPHKASHTAVAVDGDENVIGEFRLRAGPSQASQLREWAARFEQPRWAVESAGGLGYLLAQQLVAAGETVFDVAPTLAARVRLLGVGRTRKNDPNDAASVAVAALRSHNLQAVCVDDHPQVLRLLAKRHRDLARLRAKHCNRLHALLLELKAGGITSKITVNKAAQALDGIETSDEAARCRVLIGRELVADIAAVDQALKVSKKRVTSAVAASGTTLTDIVGIGPIGAATIIGYTRDINRFETKGHFASFNATAPIEASSGPKVRHRLNPGGNRRVNHVIHIAAINQLRLGGEGREYYDRKKAEGKTSKEAIRALKRRISDRIYQHLKADTHRTTTD